MWAGQASKAQKDELLWYEIQSPMANETKQSFCKNQKWQEVKHNQNI